VVVPLYSIGALARLVGLPTKTIRFYSDAGILPPSARTEAGHRRYDDGDVGRLQLIRTLREVGIDLRSIGRILDARGNATGILATHVATLEGRIRSLQRQLVVLRAAGDSPTEVTLARVQALARLDALERRQLLEAFWSQVAPDAARDEAVRRLRDAGIPELPDDATAEQLDSWIELATLASDPDFIASIRRMTSWDGGEGADFSRPAYRRNVQRALELAEPLLASGVASDDERARDAAWAFVRGWAAAFGRRASHRYARELIRELDARTDPRAARFWDLVARVRGGAGAPSRPASNAAFPWLIDAVRAIAA
jgi:DNA-binding transcriptional MerR regulator